jgi:hypothetical protein
MLMRSQNVCTVRRVFLQMGNPPIQVSEPILHCTLQVLKRISEVRKLLSNTQKRRLALQYRKDFARMQAVAAAA